MREQKTPPSRREMTILSLLVVAVFLLAGHDVAALDTFTPEELLKCERHRASSNDSTGENDDCFHFAPGERQTLLETADGSGAIVRLWCTVKNDAPDYLEKVRICCIFDGETTVDDIPFGMFFATGPWRVNDVQSQQVNVMRARPGNAMDSGVGRGSFNAHWEMPFCESARIEVSNGTHESMTLHFNIDYLTGPVWSSAPFLFHAEYHAAKPTSPASGESTLNPERNFLLADILRQEGFYVGTVLCVESHSDRPGKWYEGDETFIIDGAPWQSAIHGTGTEDYFGMAWGVHRPYQAFDHGVTHYERNLTEEDRFYDGRFVLYRWHVSDPVMFHSSLHASIEAGHANDCAQRYESVSFWYGRQVSSTGKE
jgi:hypothetical protein